MIKYPECNTPEEAGLAIQNFIRDKEGKCRHEEFYIWLCNGGILNTPEILEYLQKKHGKLIDDSDRIDMSCLWLKGVHDPLKLQRKMIGEWMGYIESTGWDIYVFKKVIPL